MDERHRHTGCRLEPAHASARRLLDDMGATHLPAASLVQALHSDGWVHQGSCIDGSQAQEDTQQPATVTALECLRDAATALQNRAVVRDSPDGERSVGPAIQAFNAIYGAGIVSRIEQGLPPLAEAHGWQFQSLLKKARGAQGAYHADDHTDDVGYTALAAECAAREHSTEG